MSHMGFLTSGPKSDPTVIKSLIASVFTGATNQEQVDNAKPTFLAKVKEFGILVRPIVLGKERIVFHEKHGVIVDGYKFTFPADK